MADDLTLDEMRIVLAPLVAANAAFDGWTPAALDAAATQAGIDPGHARLAFPGAAPDMIDAWFAHVDTAMAAALTPEKLATMRFRDRITALVEQRLTTLAPNRDALRRALAVLARPTNVALGVRLGWRAADAMWRLAGDTATDLNHYTKRLTLGGIYAATLMAFLDDESEDHADTRAFLSRRIDGIMRFEKLKSEWRGDPERRLSLVRFLGRLRYPAV